MVVHGERLKALFAKMLKGYEPTKSEFAAAVIGDLLTQLGIEGAGAAE